MGIKGRHWAALAAVTLLAASSSAQDSPPRGADDDIIVNGQRIRVEGGWWQFSSTASLDARRRSAGGGRTWARCIAAGDRQAVLMQLIDHMPPAQADARSGTICTPLRFRLTGATLRGRQSCIRSQAYTGMTSAEPNLLRIRADLGDNAMAISYRRTGEIAQWGVSTASDYAVKAKRTGDCVLPTAAPVRDAAVPATPPASPVPQIMPAQTAPQPQYQPQPDLVQEGHDASPERPTLSPPPPPGAGKPDDIIVVARKLRLLRLHYASTGRVLYWCHADVSSGDKRVDRIGCAILRACVREGNDTRPTALTCLRRKIDEVAADAPPGSDG